MSEAAPTLSRWDAATLAACLFAADPHGFGILILKAKVGPARERWIACLRRGLDSEVPFRRLPAGIADDRLLGGLDLAATLEAGRPVADRGLLAEADGGVILAPMAERLSAGTAARLASVLDRGEVASERDGSDRRFPARFGLVLLDESDPEDAPVPAALIDRAAFIVDLDGLRGDENTDIALPVDAIRAASVTSSAVAGAADTHEAVCGVATALGVASMRVPLAALKAARVYAALMGRQCVAADDLAVATQLVLLPRATRFPAGEPDRPAEPEAQDQQAEPPMQDAQDQTQEAELKDRSLEDVVLEAVAAAIPDGLLAKLLSDGARARQGLLGKAGASVASPKRGRPVGARRGDWRSGARIDLLATLRAAAPWQSIRRKGDAAERGPRVLIGRDDVRIRRFAQRTQTTTIFAVDASGSAALHRLAECKGAVQLLLADCYVRRDEVALVAFRGDAAELILAPTRSLARARRTLAGLPGGGATPLAAGIDAAVEVGLAERRRGNTPAIVLLTDGRGNIGRDGRAGRAHAAEDARAAARRAASAGLSVLLIDTSPQPQPQAAALADEMRARYLPLPHADARRLSQAVQAAGRTS